MAELYDFARPVVRRAARLDADQARRQLGKKWQHLRPPKRLANNNGNRRSLRRTKATLKATRGDELNSQRGAGCSWDGLRAQPHDTVSAFTGRVK